MPVASALRVSAPEVVTGGDPFGRGLTLGLGVLVLLAPLPFGAVGPAGRLGLELGAFALGVLWLLRATVRAPLLPPLSLRIALIGLLGVGASQLIPLSPALISWLSPRAGQLRTELQPTGAALVAERQLLGLEPSALDAPATLSLDAPATASALRTGTALVVLFLAAYAGAASRGAHLLALSLTLSASFQGLYGLLVLASGHDKIWHVPKPFALDSATGTYINPNHFACFLAMALPCGIALLLERLPANRRRSLREAAAELFGAEGSRRLLLGVLLIVALAGLLASYSRTGIALGLLAIMLALLAGRHAPGLKLRLAAGLLIVGAAAVPLAQIGSEKLLLRYADTAESLTAAGGRTRVWLDTLEIASAFPLVGSGFGTFSSIYPLFRSAEVRPFYAHAHNDLLQLLAEGGVPSMLLLGLLLWPLLRTLVHALSGSKGSLGVGFAAGLTAVLLHALVDFDFHIPANAATAAVLAGTLEGLPCIRR